jgi:CheY-like chemotaxis protein
MPGGGRLRFETTNLEVTPGQSAAAKLAPGRYVRLRVSDTGMGMVPEVARHAFEPFFTTKDTGTGMGLAAVYGTVGDHEGLVELETEPGQGTTFTLYLPVTTKDPAPSPQPPVVAGQAEHGRVLVVDDEPAVARVARDVLLGIGYQVDVCEGGRAALERFGPDRYDIVLLDITMPEVDGVEILRRLREVDPRVAVLLMTGHASGTIRERLRDYPEVSVLSKPFSNERLAAAVRRTRTAIAP